jgi:hypothetical protein
VSFSERIVAAARHLAWVVAVLVAKPLEKVALDGELAYGLQQLVVLLLGGFLLLLSLEFLPVLAEDVLGPLFQELVSPLPRPMAGRCSPRPPGTVSCRPL